MKPLDTCIITMMVINIVQRVGFQNALEIALEVVLIYNLFITNPQYPLKKSIHFSRISNKKQESSRSGRKNECH
jgi:hypothetical protein